MLPDHAFNQTLIKVHQMHRLYRLHCPVCATTCLPWPENRRARGAAVDQEPRAV